MAIAKTTAYIALTEIRHDGEDLAVGDTLMLTAAQAEQLVAMGAVEAAPAEGKAATGKK